jgi:hypothetical protein
MHAATRDQLLRRPEDVPGSTAAKRIRKSKGTEATAAALAGTMVAVNPQAAVEAAP